MSDASGRSLSRGGGVGASAETVASAGGSRVLSMARGGLRSTTFTGRERLLWILARRTMPRPGEHDNRPIEMTARLPRRRSLVACRTIRYRPGQFLQLDRVA